MSDLVHRFESMLSSKGTACAFIAGDQRMSMRDVNERANQFAHWLAKQDLASGAVIGLLLTPSASTGAYLLGIVKAGMVFLGLDASYPAARLRYMIQQSGANLVVVGNEELVHTVEGVYQITEEELISEISGESISNPATTLEPGRPAYITFTSGSTGVPKAILAGIDQVENRFEWMWEEYPFRAGEVCCQRMPLSFIDSLWEFLGPILCGTPVIILPISRALDNRSFVKSLRDSRVSRMWILPAALNRLLGEYPNLGEHLPHLRFWVCTGDALSFALAEKFYEAVPNGTLHNLYGTSEVWDATWYEVPRKGTSLCVPIGYPIRGVNVSIVDAQGKSTPNGQVGEIAVSGMGLAKGYLSEPRGRLEEFTRPVSGSSVHAYFTGDLGSASASNCTIFSGRRESVLQRNSQLICTCEIEAALSFHPSVAECSAIAVSSGSDSAAVSACYSLKPGCRIVELELARFLADLLSRESLPDRLINVDSFPMTPSGKIDRRVLGERIRALPEKSKSTIKHHKNNHGSEAP